IGHGNGFGHVHFTNDRLGRRLERRTVVLLLMMAATTALAGTTPVAAGGGTDLAARLETATALASTFGLAGRGGRRRAALGIARRRLVLGLGRTVKRTGGRLGDLGGLFLFLLFGTQACLFFGLARIDRSSGSCLALLTGAQVGDLAFLQGTQALVVALARSDFVLAENFGQRARLAEHGGHRRRCGRRGGCRLASGFGSRRCFGGNG